MATLLEFLSQTPVLDGVYRLSPPRAFAHDEEQYDQHRPPEKCTAEFIREEGATLFAFFERHGLARGAPIVEIGCGSGAMSVSMASHPDAGHLLITDPSLAFCRITQRKLAQVDIQAARVDCAALRAEDVDILPPGSVSLIFLRSVLHHILDIEGFLARCAKVLPVGGLLICEEPYYEGYLLMGFLAQVIPDALAAAGTPCTPEERERIENFVATMQYYSRRDLDKSDAEDKHLFRPDELRAMGYATGMDLTHYPNWHIALSAAKNEERRLHYFERFFADYLRLCMNWPAEFVERVVAVSGKYFRFFDPVEAGGNTVPHCFGTFVFTRR